MTTGRITVSQRFSEKHVRVLPNDVGGWCVKAGKPWGVLPNLQPGCLPVITRKDPGIPPYWPGWFSTGETIHVHRHRTCLVLFGEVKASYSKRWGGNDGLVDAAHWLLLYKHNLLWSVLSKWANLSSLNDLVAYPKMIEHRVATRVNVEHQRVAVVWKKHFD